MYAERIACAPRDPLDGVLAALPNQPILLALVRADLQLKHEPVIDADIRDAELRSQPLRHFDPSAIMGSRNTLQIRPQMQQRPRFNLLAPKLKEIGCYIGVKIRCHLQVVTEASI